jgi:hypothetical protein
MTGSHTTMTTALVAELVVGHLVQHGLPEPASLHLTTNTLDQAEARVQVHGASLTHTARLLLAWANTLTDMTLRAWRPENSTSVHLDVDAILTGPQGTVALRVFGGTDFTEAVFPGLEPGQIRPVSLGQLTAWAAGTGVEVTP